NLTMANITLPSTVFDDMTDYRKMIEENTILDNFVVRKQTTSTDICKLLLWIGSRHNLNPLRRSRDLYLKYWNINWHA
ncbi:unnamed protein product, partial [Rotaria magnacalcarata]